MDSVSPENQKETDVSSTTEDNTVISLPMGPSSAMEVTIEVSEASVEVEESNEEQDERIDSNTFESKLPSPVEVLSTEANILVDNPEHTSQKQVLTLFKSDNTNECVDISKSSESITISSPIRHSFETVTSNTNKLEETVTQKTEQSVRLDSLQSSVATLETLDGTDFKDSSFNSVLLSSPRNALQPNIKKINLKDNEKEVSAKTLEFATSTDFMNASENNPQTTSNNCTQSPEDDVSKTYPVSEVISDKSLNNSKLEQKFLSKPEAFQSDEQPLKLNNSEVIHELETTLLPIDKSNIDDIGTSKKDGNVLIPVELQVEEIRDKEIFDDSIIDGTMIADASDKDNNKSFSRELKSLIDSAKESKIISECTQLKSKTRKSRILPDSPNLGLNISGDAGKIQGSRRESCNSQKSSCSEKSDKAPLKRSMRSQNPEFVSKHKLFLNSVTGKHSKDDDILIDINNVEVSDEVKKKGNPLDKTVKTPKKKKNMEEKAQKLPGKLSSDPYCWCCHWAIEEPQKEKTPQPGHCSICPRSFHFKCLSLTERTKLLSEKNWVCPKCMKILDAESSETKSSMMQKISLEMLSDVLKYALQRMMELSGVEPFMNAVDKTAFPDYDKYIVHPVDLNLMKESIAAGLYRSTESFVSDAQWILHNSIIFNTGTGNLSSRPSVPVQSKLTAAARALVRACRIEMGEIEACPECYAAAHARRSTWFTDVCSTPHILLWAKLKGFPHWPAKGMSVNSSGMIDVRFFGAHDRAWVPARDCYLYCMNDPNNFRTKRQDILDSMQEAEEYIKNITRKFGKFVYAKFKVQFDPDKLNEQLKLMIPGYDSENKKEISSPVKTSSPTTSPVISQDSLSKSEASEVSEPTVERKGRLSIKIRLPRKEKDKNERAKSAEVDIDIKSNANKKRRRSVLEEAVLTVMNPSTNKRKCLVNAEMVVLDKTDTSVLEKSPIDTSETTTVNKVDVTPKPISRLSENEVETGRITPNPVTRASTPNTAKQTPKVNTPKEEDKVKKSKAAKRDKSSSSDREKSTNSTRKNETSKLKRDRSSSGNKSLKHSSEEDKKSASKKSRNNLTNSAKEKSNSDDSISNKIVLDSIASTSKSRPTKSIADKLIFDDDDTTSLAVLAKKSNQPRLPTITNVRSLSQTDMQSKTSTEANSSASIFTHTTTEDVNNTQKQKENLDQPMIGRVGVRAFARMTSPSAAQTKSSDQIEVEIKAEPMDYEDAARQSEKLNLMNAFQLRPVNPQNSMSNLREVRMNKTATANNTQNRMPVVFIPNDSRPRARKTFPQSQKTGEIRSELSSKNSMVYIPIQPPMTQAPIRAAAKAQASTNGPVPVPPLLRQVSCIASSSNNVVNTVTTPLMQVTSTTASVTNISSTIASTSQLPNQVMSVTSGPGNHFNQVPTSVHTVPLITSVNGQWTFSLQPMMSVGGIDGRPPSPPMLNGISEPPLLPLTNAVVGNVTNLVTPSQPLPNRTPGDSSQLGEPPRLVQKPGLITPLDSNTPLLEMPCPPGAGTVSAKLNQNAAKLAGYFRVMLEDSLSVLAQSEPAPANVLIYKKQIEQLQWRHKQEIEELKHNHELVVNEMRLAFEKEKLRLVEVERRNHQNEMQQAVKHAKSRQWCAHCQKEAQFYCCWNTSYCDYPCQQAHWSQHFSVCTQSRKLDALKDDDNSIDLTDDGEKPPENPPKTSSSTHTVGGKKNPSKVCTPANSSNQTKSSIIVSMMEDNNGNQTVKCVGTYKPPSAQSSPVILNKQLSNNEDNSAKKVVTSGGYLIIGASPTGTQNLVLN